MNKKFILITDDEPEVLNSIKRYLEDYNYTIATAKNGKECLDKFVELKPDLILLDLFMPEMNGFDVLEKISSKYPETPVIVMSGTGIIEHCIDAIHKGAWDYLLKPIKEMSHLVHTIEKVFDKVQLKNERKKYQNHLESTLKQIKSDEDMGRIIQQKLLPPQKLSFKNYTIKYFFKPSMILSGDFLDYVFFKNKYIIFYSADVSGHGVSSSLITVLLKGFIRKYYEGLILNNIHDILKPNKILNNLNNELIKENLGKHIVIFFGIIDLENNTLHYSSAGQYPFPFIFSDDKTTQLDKKNFPVGLFPFAEYISYKKNLPEKFKLTIYSDGILDILPQNSNKEKIEFLQTLKNEKKFKKFIFELNNRKSVPDDITIMSLIKE